MSGPVALGEPAGDCVKRVQSARDMLAQVEVALPVDIAIFAAAVADWRVAIAGEQKLTKTEGGMPQLALVENPDILATILEIESEAATAGDRLCRLRPSISSTTPGPSFVAARAATGSSPMTWSPALGVMGGDRNTVHLLTRHGEEIDVDSWPVMTKEEVAAELIAKVGKSVAEKAS